MKAEKIMNQVPANRSTGPLAAGRGFTFLLILLIVFPFSKRLHGQINEQNRFGQLNVRAGLGFEYFNRAITWDEKEAVSDLKAYELTLQLDFHIEGGFTLSTFGGLSFSNYDGLEFANLPLTLALEVGSIKGLFVGGELKRSIVRFRAFEISGWGQFVYSHGNTQEWIIPELSVEGTATGQPYWFRAALGPELKYLGLDHMYLYPYLSIAFNRLWGTFKMEQSIQDLDGMEELKFESRSDVNIRLGTDYDLTDFIGLRGELSLYPGSNHIDMGFVFKALLSF